MKIALVHNFYQQPGGEDQFFYREGDLLESRGHTVVRYTRHNDDLRGRSRLHMAADSVWNSSEYRNLRRLFREEGVQVAHFHNTLPIISPAGYHAARAEGVAVVQTLHNYRLLCVKGQFLRDGRICEDCAGRSFQWPGVVHGCYRESRATSGVVAGTLFAHSLLGTWKETVNVYLVHHEFARKKFIEGGLPAHKIRIKPGFLDPDPGPGEGNGGYALFVGRLSPEKGISVMLDAWRRLGRRMPLKVIGDGPLRQQVEDAAREIDGVEYLGQRKIDEVLSLMGEAFVTVLPSVWYEVGPCVINETFAKGTPLLSSALGGMAAMNDDGRTGLTFRPGDPSDLAAKFEWLLDHPDEYAGMRRQARAEFEAKYTADRNHRLLIEAYEAAIDDSGTKKGAGTVFSGTVTGN
jgi:glycosyltransferase involved in cell wall biosynthesis